MCEIINKFIIPIIKKAMNKKFKSLYDSYKLNEEINNIMNKLEEYLIETSKNNESGILENDKFWRIFDNHKIINDIFDYVFTVDNQSISEMKFISKKLNELIKYLNEDNCSLRVHEDKIIEELLINLLSIVRKAAFDKLKKEDKYIDYQISQTKNEIKESTEEIVPLLKEIKKDTGRLMDKKTDNNELSEENIEYYHLWIRNYEKEIKLYDELDTGISLKFIIEFIQKLIDHSWKNNLIEVLCSLKEDALKWEINIENTISLIKKNISYKIINQSILELVGKIETGKEKLNKILNQGYNKVILISGECGTGKTYFLKQYIMNQNEKQDKVILVPFEYKFLQSTNYENLKNNINNAILNKINEILNEKYKNLEDILGSNFYYNFVIIIEDIESFYYANPQLFKGFLDEIKDLCIYDNLKFIITINEFSLYILEDTELIEKYCVNFKEFYNQRCIPIVYNYALSITSIDDKYNIGEKILDVKNIKIYNDNQSNAKKIFIKPYYANILGKNYYGKEIMLNLTSYFEFMNEVVNGIRRKLKLSLIDEVEIDRTQCNYIDNAIKEISNIVLQYKKIILSSKLIFLEDKVSENSIRVLNNYDLLKFKEEKEPSLFSDSIENELIYELNTSIYWVANIEHYEVKRAKEDIEQIYSDFCNIKDYKQELIYFFLLDLDKNNKLEECEKLINVLMKENELYFILFYAGRGSTVLNKLLISLLCDEENKILSRRETFALLYYLNNYSAKVSDKFKIIANNVESIERNSDIHDLENVIENILNCIQNLKSFKNNTKELYKIKNDKIGSFLGYKCGKYLYKFLKNEKLEMEINGMWNYLNTEIKLCKNKSDKNKIVFVEWIIRSYFEKLIYDNDLYEIYDLIATKGYFSYKKSTGKLFRRNFVAAAGNNYSKNNCSIEYKEKYYDLIKWLIDNSDIDDDPEANNLMAFHLITNTIEDDVKLKKLDNYKLKKYLQYLLKEPKLNTIIKNEKTTKLLRDNNIIIDE